MIAERLRLIDYVNDRDFKLYSHLDKNAQFEDIIVHFEG